MSRLTDKINSDYFESRNALNRSDGVVIEVFTENEDDIPFWKDIFNRFQLQTKIHPASKTSLTRGKQEVLKMQNLAGAYMLLCVDSDYDYLLNGATNQSKSINQNPFIFQTYTYSPENYKCYAQNLNQILVEATLNDNQVFDCEHFIKNYSDIIYELFLCSFYYERKFQKENEIHQTEYSEKELDAISLQNWQNENLPKHDFSISDFCTTVRLENLVNFNDEQELNKLAERVKFKLESLPSIDENEVASLKNELLELGLHSQNTYLFIQGHTLYENVIPLLMNPLYNFMKSQKMREFNDLGISNIEKENKRNQYKNQITDFKAILQTNKVYYGCFLMNKIKTDIENYLTNHLRT